MASFRGTSADDIQYGTAETDSLMDESGGDDEFYGEGGDDSLTAFRSDVTGSVLLDGGAGRDQITFQAYQPVTAILRGGDDADFITSGGGSQIEIDAGDGDDLVVIAHEGPAYCITLGSGADLLAFGGVWWTWYPGPAIVITDFEVGPGGDRLALDRILAKLPQWDSYQNPFLTGHLALEQRGGDAVLRIDRNADGHPIDLIVFQGVSAADLTADNLGFSPDASATPGRSFTGTESSDIFYGTGGDDVFEGGDDVDTIEAGAGNDLVNGGDGWDQLDGQFGDDELHGGADGDSLRDSGGGNDRFYGEAGSDHLRVERNEGALASTLLLDGGDDNDGLHFWSGSHRRLDTVTMLGGRGNDNISVSGALVSNIDAGEGNDTLDLTLIHTAYTITLGAGADVARVGNYGFAARWTGQLRFTDFEAGAAGDRLELSTSLLRGKLDTWDGTGDPFASGNLVLAQQGADAVILYDRDGGADGFETLVTFENLAANSLTAFNLGDRAIPASIARAGGAAADSLTGTSAADVLLGFDGNDRLSGGDGNDRLAGMEGADSLIGGAGQDVMLGGVGDDAYLVDDGGDVVIERAGEGRDTVYALGNLILTAGTEVEVLTAYDRAGSTPLVLTGNAFANLIYGNMGSNGLVGGGGTDTLYGLGGNDSYIVDDVSDIVVEAAGQGYDTVYAMGSYALQASAEIEVMTAYDRSSTAALDLTGSASANTLYGNMGANILRGGGGSDTLHGLGGDDVYIVNDAAAVVIEGARQGVDRVLTTVSYALSASAEVEELLVYDWATTTSIKLTGSASDNAIYGNMGDNGLVGGGGTDTLVGMAGNDSYIVDDASDQVAEITGQGRDTVYAMGSYTLQFGSEVEVLTAYDRSATASVNLTGNEYDNILYGNAGSNGLIGGGGSDTLYGGGGDDSYLARYLDVVIEAAGQGRDTIYALGSYALAAGSEVEVLTAYDRANTVALTLVGNSYANTLYGNAGGNVLNGGGGADSLFGLAGADRFEFSTPLQSGSAPTVIGDFTLGEDRIALDDAAFAGIGVYSQAAFAIGSAASDADDRIIYDPLTGALRYDPDGNGAAAAIHFATLSTHPALTASEFFIF